MAGWTAGRLGACARVARGRETEYPLPRAPSSVRLSASSLSRLPGRERLPRPSLAVSLAPGKVISFAFSLSATALVFLTVFSLSLLLHPSLSLSLSLLPLVPLLVSFSFSLSRATARLGVASVSAVEAPRSSCSLSLSLACSLAPPSSSSFQLFASHLVPRRLSALRPSLSPAFYSYNLLHARSRFSRDRGDDTRTYARFYPSPLAHAGPFLLGSAVSYADSW